MLKILLSLIGSNLIAKSEMWQYELTGALLLMLAGYFLRKDIE